MGDLGFNKEDNIVLCNFVLSLCTINTAVKHKTTYCCLLPRSFLRYLLSWTHFRGEKNVAGFQMCVNIVMYLIMSVSQAVVASYSFSD